MSRCGAATVSRSSRTPSATAWAVGGARWTAKAAVQRAGGKCGRCCGRGRRGGAGTGAQANKVRNLLRLRSQACNINNLPELEMHGRRWIPARPSDGDWPARLEIYLEEWGMKEGQIVVLASRSETDPALRDELARLEASPSGWGWAPREEGHSN
jgi:hypothetical protein